MTEKIFEEASEAIVKGKAEKAVELAKRGIDEGIDPLVLMEKGFIPGINKVGDLFETGRLFLPALIHSATAMEKATEIINAAIPSEKELVSAKVVLGTVQGDVHDIGKTIVVSLFKANGFDVLDLGLDVPIARFIEEADPDQVHFFGCIPFPGTDLWTHPERFGVRILTDDFSQYYYVGCEDGRAGRVLDTGTMSADRLAEVIREMRMFLRERGMRGPLQRFHREKLGYQSSKK